MDAEFDLYNDLQSGRVVEYQITEELERIGRKGSIPKKVEIYDENGKFLASSPDICAVEKLDIIAQQ
jgi:hypothetical protein